LSTGKSSASSQPEFCISDYWRRCLESEVGTLDEHISKSILGECGIPVVKEKIVSSVKEALEAAEEFGFPVVLKGISPGKIHKTESGFVHTRIASFKETEAIFEIISADLPTGGQVLMQPHILGGPELIAGIVRDPQFGHCVMCGIGGVTTEILDDTGFGVAPISKAEAVEMINRLKSQRLLNGFRNFVEINREAYASTLTCLGNLALAYSRIHEIDVNPMIFSDGEPLAVDATIILAD